jgi:hypothetical protein
MLLVGNQWRYNVKTTKKYKKKQISGAINMKRLFMNFQKPEKQNMSTILLLPLLK